MAQSVNEDDLDELCIEDKDDDVSASFANATKHVQSIVSKIDQKALLLLYGYYKQGTEGRCTTTKPSWYDMKAKSKWEAWNALGDMPKSEAKAAYVELICKLDPNFNNASANSSGVKEGWVTVSTLKSEDPELNSSDKSIVDYVKEGNAEKVSALLKSLDESALNEILLRTDEDGLNIMHWAADRGSKGILDMLLALGANVNVTDSEMQTPLHYAASCGYVECVKVLLQNGAEAELKDSDGNDALAVTCDDDIKRLLMG